MIFKDYISKCNKLLQEQLVKLGPDVRQGQVRHTHYETTSDRKKIVQVDGKAQERDKSNQEHLNRSRARKKIQNKIQNKLHGAAYKKSERLRKSLNMKDIGAVKLSDKLAQKKAAIKRERERLQ